MLIVQMNNDNPDKICVDVQAEWMWVFAEWKYHKVIFLELPTLNLVLKICNDMLESKCMSGSNYSCLSDVILISILNPQYIFTSQI